jgi:hypothetical protein
MAGRQSIAPTAHADLWISRAIRVCSRRTPDENRERNTMYTATTRSIIAAAGLAAIGLVAWPHQATTPQAQQGVPKVHRDVVLVDVTDATLLTDEGTFDTALFNDVLGPTGAEEQLFSSLATATSTSEATTLLDATGASPVFSGDFNGAESRLFEGLFLDTLATENQLNTDLGVSPATSEAAILAEYNSLPEVPLPGSDTLPVATDTASVFDADLESIANGDFSLALSDFEGYLASFATDTSGLSDLSTVLTDLSSSFSDLSNLSPDLSTILGDLTGGLL